MIFITMVVCREEEQPTNIKNDTKHPVREFICPHKENVLGFLGGLFLVMVL
jgi:hypothetical protein